MLPGQAVQIHKSTRHSKLTGDFGEALILYWLSKHGYECARVDHTASTSSRGPLDRERPRHFSQEPKPTTGTERSSLSIPKEEFTKVARACRAFCCTPHFGIVIDGGATLRGYIVPMRHLRRLAPLGKRVASWK